MKLSDNSIDRLRSSVGRLVEKSRQLEQEVELERLKQKLEQTQAQLDAVTLSGSIIEVAGGAKAARQRVNNLLRDIDRCIAMVNK